MTVKYMDCTKENVLIIIHIGTFQSQHSKLKYNGTGRYPASRYCKITALHIIIMITSWIMAASLTKVPVKINNVREEKPGW